MCIATPGLVISVNGDIAQIDYNGSIVTANRGIVDCKKGDYVLVHAGLIIQKLSSNEASDMLDIFNELGEL
ncbi:MAG: HypC/HybG/HupF family hydrogenase formation chaperone [Eubacterium sp.]|nr:HypC/HybG/HupF family hydrogenase formation chaperone [Eubacterium sp.]